MIYSHLSAISITMLEDFINYSPLNYLKLKYQLFVQNKCKYFEAIGFINKIHIQNQTGSTIFADFALLR